VKYSQLLIPTMKETPAEAEIPSHQLMIRAGFIRKLASGAYTYLPLGWRCLRKIEAIVREEMNAAGAQEILMPILQPVELWRQTGRDADYGETMFRFTDRHGRENVLARTAEEVVTSLVATEVSSYKQLPLCLYQIGMKFRDEFRPRFGVLRSREFLMKDAYSFHASLESLEATYRAMHAAYGRIFARCGLKCVVVEAESGPIGGAASHEFVAPCTAGEDVIVHTEDFAYAANIEKAEVDPPPASPRPAEAPPMEEVHTPEVGSIEAVCAFLHARPEGMIKTLVYQADERVVVALIRGDHEVNEAKLARAAGAARVRLAEEAAIRQASGAATGFAGPTGMAERAAMLLVDPAVAAMSAGVAGANRTDYHVRNVVPGRDFPLAGDNVLLADIRNASEGDWHGGAPLVFSRGIEMGHVFKLGTKYSEKIGARFEDESGVRRPCIMGCYGIGLSRILAAAVEMDGGHDGNGCILPATIAPFEVEVLPVNVDNEAVTAAAARIYDELLAAGADVLMDDRDVRPGVKFKDADLVGIPLRVVVGEKGIAGGHVEVKRRTDLKPSLVPATEAAARVREMLAEMKRSLGRQE
jgi:prolyl-tRNA synthetase